MRKEHEMFYVLLVLMAALTAIIIRNKLPKKKKKPISAMKEIKERYIGLSNCPRRLVLTTGIFKDCFRENTQRGELIGNLLFRVEGKNVSKSSTNLVACYWGLTVYKVSQYAIDNVKDGCWCTMKLCVPIITETFTRKQYTDDDFKHTGFDIVEGKD